MSASGSQAGLSNSAAVSPQDVGKKPQNLHIINPFFASTSDQEHGEDYDKWMKSPEGRGELKLAKDILSRSVSEAFDVRPLLTDLQENKVAHPRDVGAKLRSYIALHLFLNGIISDDEIRGATRACNDPGPFKEVADEVKKSANKMRTAALKAILQAMSRLYDRYGPKDFDNLSMAQRTQVFEWVYDKFPLYIDRELHEPLKRIFDLKAIHSSETSFSAEGYRKFNRCRFLELAEVTMTSRVSNTRKSREPVNSAWKSFHYDTEIKNQCGVSTEIGEIPIQPLQMQRWRERGGPIPSRAEGNISIPQYDSD